MIRGSLGLYLLFYFRLLLLLLKWFTRHWVILHRLRSFLRWFDGRLVSLNRFPLRFWGLSLDIVGVLYWHLRSWGSFNSLLFNFVLVALFNLQVSLLLLSILFRSCGLWWLYSLSLFAIRLLLYLLRNFWGGLLLVCISLSFLIIRLNVLFIALHFRFIDLRRCFVLLCLWVTCLTFLGRFWI